MKKTFIALAIMMSGVIGIGGNYVLASPVVDAHKQEIKLSVEKDKKQMPPRMYRQRLSNSEAAAKLQGAYGFRYSEMLRLLNIGHSYEDMNTACLYAYLTGVSVEKILQLRIPTTWGRVRVQLGLTPAVYADKYVEYQVSYMMNNSLVGRDAAVKYLKQGYPLSDILQAEKLSKVSDKSLAEILSMRTVTCDWQQVKIKLGLNTGNEKDIRSGRGQRKGAGFAGLHVKNMTAKRAANIFHADYLFPEEELLQLYEKYGYEDLEDICLYAYMSKRSLQEIITLRDKYSWERMKYVIGLNPQTYFERCVDYQARRLYERMAIPKKVTKKYMYNGYAMHHVNTAYLLAQKANKNIDEVIDMKTPKNSWTDVALKIGLTAEDSEQIKNKISKEFGRHE